MSSAAALSTAASYAPPTSPSSLIVCNIYISAGKPKHSELLLKLLTDAQKECQQYNAVSRKARNEGRDDVVMVVHAFSDCPYDRSSIHIAGSSTLVQKVASSVTVEAITQLSSFLQHECEHHSQPDDDDSAPTPHPNIGLVDHVSVLPLHLEDTQPDDLAASNATTDSALPVTGQVARAIGDVISSKCGVEVLYYGYADPNNTPLAVVRRERTSFFQKPSSTTTTTTKYNRCGQQQHHQTTVGAPPYFTENYNIRLTATVSKRQAQSLTKMVRERDNQGGLPYVEALTLPYHRKRDNTMQYEVACNLLNPNVSSTHDIDGRVKMWEDFCKEEQHQEQEQHPVLVEKSYRVGTTVEMCLHALEQASTKDTENHHNQQVVRRLREYLTVESD